MARPGLSWMVHRGGFSREELSLPPRGVEAGGLQWAADQDPGSGGVRWWGGWGWGWGTGSMEEWGTLRAH